MKILSIRLPLGLILSAILSTPMLSTHVLASGSHTVVSKDGYVIEGHIPAKYITQFLNEKPINTLGLSVPGMPVGSPGMEYQNKFMPYQVLVLNKDGTSSIYAEIDNAVQQ